MPTALLDAPRLTLSQAARKLGVHTSALYRWSHGLGGRRLPLTRIGGRTYVLVADLDRWIAERSDPRPAAESARDLCARADEAGRVLEALGV